MRWICCLFLAFGIFVSLGAAEFSVHSGYRFDRLRVDSDCHFETQSVEVLIKTGSCLSEHLLFEGELGFGVVFDGRHSWSDFTWEGWQSRSDSHSGDFLADATVGLGYIVPMQDGGWCLIPKGGASLNYLRLGETKAICLGPWVGLESRWMVGALSSIRVELLLQGGLNDWAESGDIADAFWGLEGRTSWEFPLTDALGASLGVRACWKRACVGGQWRSGSVFGGLRF